VCYSYFDFQFDTIFTTRHLLNGIARMLKKLSFFIYHFKLFMAVMTLLLAITWLCPGQNADAAGKQPINIGVVFDGRENKNNPFVSLLRDELNALLGSKYNIRMDDRFILPSGWSAEAINNNYNRLVSDPDINIIIAAGAITGSIVSRKEPYKKPVIAIGMIDPVVQGVTPGKNNTSGIHNLTYIMGNRSIVKDLETFHEVYPYKRLGFAYFGELNKTITREGHDIIDILMIKNRSKIIKIPIKNSIDEVFSFLDQVDALYISYLGKFEGKEKIDLIHKLNEQKIPTFGASIADTRSGILAAMAPEDVIIKLIRRISLNVEAILEGTDPAQLNVLTEFENKLTINIKTAKAIDFSPKFTILAQAQLINEHFIDAERKVSLVDVMKEAIQTNLDLKVSETYIQSAAQDISKAKTDYYPSFSADLTGVVIDDKRAQKSNGTLAERTTTGSVSGTQLIYSDQVLGNIASQKDLYQASQLDHENTELDIVLSATEAYFKILKAKTSRKILKDNIELIKRNLKTAEQREVIGYSGRSDVLRWKSQLATTSTELLAAGQEVILAKNDLNRILNRSQDELFHIQDTSMDDHIFSKFNVDSIATYIDNQKSLDAFTRFFIGQSIGNSVQIDSLDKKISSIERSIAALKRKHYMPTVSFTASQDHVFTRNGDGSDVAGVDPVDNPWTAGVYLNLPFYDGGVSSIEVKKNLIEISRVKKQQLILSQDIEKNARSAISDAMVKMVNLELSRQAAMFAKQSLELVQDAYAEGTVSVVELADAQNNALTGDLNAISSVYEYLISLFRMERVYGRFSLLLPVDNRESLTKKFKEYYDTSVN